MNRQAHGDQGDGTYRNPVLFADYSDPDVIAVGEDYYLTASSFNCIPGLPVLHSRDLVNWRIIGHALAEFPDPAYRQPQHGKGVWAPAIRFHDGKFRIFFGAPDEGIFMTTAERPEGPWSPPHCVQAGRGLIDPCPFWDADGRAWLIRAQAGSRCDGVNSLLTLHGMAPDGSRLLDEGRVVVDGHFHHPTVEGPKLYWRNGYYYIFAPAGGVRGGWQAVFRSRSIDGPYEDRILLTQGGTPVNGPHQGAWVETVHGEHWFLHFQDLGHCGRVLHLQPMRWEDDGWPRIGGPAPAVDVTEPVLHHRKPVAVPETGPLRPPGSDAFAGDAPGPQWQWMANPDPAWWAMAAPGLRLVSQGTPSGGGSWLEAGNLLVRKPLDPAYAVAVDVELEDARPGDSAGLLLSGGAWGGIFLEATASGLQLCQAVIDDFRNPEVRVVDRLHWKSAAVRLQLSVRDGVCTFHYAGADGGLRVLGGAIRARDASWMGARIGLLALNPGRAPSGGAAVYRNFDYHPIH